MEKARRTVVVSEDLGPSAEPRTVKHGEQVAVTVPGGLLKAPAKVTIAAVEGEPPANSGMLEKLAAWDISVGELHELDAPVTIEMAYDPARLRAGAKPEDQIATGYWDAGVGAWVSTPFRVDAARRRIAIEARHLSLRSAWAIREGALTSLSTHFRLIYNATANYPLLDRERARELRDPALTFVLQVRTCLEAAWDAFSAAGFKMPQGRTDVHGPEQAGLQPVHAQGGQPCPGPGTPFGAGT